MVGSPPTRRTERSCRVLCGVGRRPPPAPLETDGVSCGIVASIGRADPAMDDIDSRAGGPIALESGPPSRRDEIADRAGCCPCAGAGRIVVK